MRTAPTLHRLLQRPRAVRSLLGVTLLLAAPQIVRAGHCDVAGSSGLTLLEPIGTAHCFYGSADSITMINAYLSTLMPWLLGLCATYCVLMVALGGAEIIVSGGSEQLKESGKKRIIHSIIGLVLLTFSAAILNFLNASFFT